MNSISRFLSLVAFILIMSTGLTQAGEKDSFSVQLMGAKDIDGYGGCRFALWQNNRDPKKDKYSYALFMPYNDGEALPIWVKVNGKIIEMTPLARGGWKDGYLNKYMLYRQREGSYFAILNILDKKQNGSDLLITDARLRIVHSGKKTFTIRTKGHISCPKAVKDHQRGVSPLRLAKDYDAINLTKIKDFKSLKTVPILIRKYIHKNIPECDLGTVPPYGAAYAVSPARTIWEIPCYTGAYQGSYIYADALNANEKYFSFLEFPRPQGEKTTKEIISPQIKLKGAVFTSTALDRGLGDCGTRDVYQLVPDVGEELLFVLLERRRKSKCDGKDVAPENWPLTFRRQ